MKYNQKGSRHLEISPYIIYCSGSRLIQWGSKPVSDTWVQTRYLMVNWCFTQGFYIDIIGKLSSTDKENYRLQEIQFLHPVQHVLVFNNRVLEGCARLCNIKYMQQEYEMLLGKAWPVFSLLQSYSQHPALWYWCYQRVNPCLWFQRTGNFSITSWSSNCQFWAQHPIHTDYFFSRGIILL